VRKYLLKQLLRRLGLGEIAERPKRGFGLPMHRWLTGEQSSWTRDLLLSPDSRCHAFFDPSVIEQWLDRSAATRRNFGERLWALLWFEQWCRSFKIG